ncbi:hypothetical protein HUJ05_012835 [Dendroctonus ponderosae]|nr:hypothetical protein HUJ05_012835 [Dendroctonus ponderosae]
MATCLTKNPIIIYSLTYSSVHLLWYILCAGRSSVLVHAVKILLRKCEDMNEVMDVLEEKAHLFVEKLLSEGAATPCDDTADSFNQNADLPPFYDEELFKRGQAFYHRNIFALFTAKLFGLIAVLSIPSILQILKHTKMSGTNMTAYRRYSIKEVKNLHNSASNRGCKAGLHRISQKDMVLTQFGFMGFQLTREKMLGVHNATPEEWMAFIHVWRVVGHMLGIEDRFNICNGSVAEVKARCEKLIQQVFIPHIKKNDPEFLQMSRYLVNGLWAINPILNFNAVMCSMQFLLANKINYDSMEYKKLHFWEKLLLVFIAFVLFSLRWAPFRWYHNSSKYRDFWLMEHFPFLGYYKYGFKNAHVKILGKDM